MNEIHIHLHIADASSLNLSDLIAQARGATPALDSTSVTGSLRTFYVAVYRSMRQRFALGYKLYDFEEGAERNAGAENFSGTAPFTLDLTNRRVIGDGSSADRFWAVLQNSDGTYSLGRNSFTSQTALRAEYPDLFAVLGGREDSDGDVVLSGV